MPAESEPRDGREEEPGYVDEYGDTWHSVSDAAGPAPGERATVFPPTAYSSTPGVPPVQPYRGLSSSAPASSGSRGAGRGWLAVATVGAVFVAGILWAGIAGSLQDRDSRADDRASSDYSVTAPPTTRTPRVPSAASRCDRYAPLASAATPPGWQTIVGPRGLTYDVPAEWKALTCGTIVGWETKCDNGPFGVCIVRAMNSAAELPMPEPAECREESVALTGLAGSSNAPTVEDAIRLEKRTVKRVYTTDDEVTPVVEFSVPQSLTVKGRPALRVDADVTQIGKEKCGAPSAKHIMVATTILGQPGSVVLIISLKQGVAGAVDPAVADRIVASLRPSARK